MPVFLDLDLMGRPYAQMAARGASYGGGVAPDFCARRAHDGEGEWDGGGGQLDNFIRLLRGRG